jgi:hypothetical protein
LRYSFVFIEIRQVFILGDNKEYQTVIRTWKMIYGRFGPENQTSVLELMNYRAKMLEELKDGFLFDGINFALKSTAFIADIGFLSKISKLGYTGCNCCGKDTQKCETWAKVAELPAVGLKGLLRIGGKFFGLVF